MHVDSFSWVAHWAFEQAQRLDRREEAACHLIDATGFLPLKNSALKLQLIENQMIWHPGQTGLMRSLSIGQFEILTRSVNAVMQASAKLCTTSCEPVYLSFEILTRLVNAVMRASAKLCTTSCDPVHLSGSLNHPLYCKDGEVR